VLTLPEGSHPQWKRLLVSVVEDLMEQQSGAVVFFWDEFPQMLHNIAKESPEDAMEILNTLRSLRQHHERLRMVLTGPSDSTPSSLLSSARGTATRRRTTCARSRCQLLIPTML
jgi:hypothetical protein